MSGIVVSSGVVSSGLVVNGAETLTVLPGGTALATTVEDVSLIVISSGGYASGAELDDFSTASIQAGATASGFNIAVGAVETVFGHAAGDTISGAEIISSGGVAAGAFVESGGQEDVYAGGTESGATIVGGTEFIYAGGIASADVVAEGSMILSGGSATDVAVGSLCELVLFGGSANNIKIDDGSLIVLGGTASDATLSTGGLVVASAGVISSLTNIDGDMTISGGGTALDTTVSGGATMLVISGGVASGTIVIGGSKDGFLYVKSGGTESGGTVSKGGVVAVTNATATDLLVLSGGTLGVYGVVAEQSAYIDGGVESVSQEAKAYGDTVISGGVMLASGLASNTIIASGGTASFTGNFTGSASGASGGRMVGAADFVGGTVEAGGFLYFRGDADAASANIEGFAVLSSYNILDNSKVTGTGTVLAGVGVLLSNTVVSGNSATIDIGSGATGLSDSIESGGVELLAGYGIADVVSGGTLVVESNGYESGGIVSSGVEQIKAGGSSEKSQILSGGTEIVSGGASVSGATIDDAIINVSTGGTSIDATLLSTGSIEYLAGVSSDTVISGGSEIVETGGFAAATTIANDGLLALEQGGFAAKSIVFSGSDADLVVSGTAMPNVPISGFTLTDAIDLASVDYASDGSVSYSDGILTVEEDGSNYEFSLAGNYGSATFALTEGASLDTIVTVTSLFCFAAGTLIAAEQGEVAVEALKVGDFVRTHDGSLRPIIWIGHRQIDCSRHPDPENILPVCVTAHAFGTNEPKRDLFLSPDHAVFRNGVLIPVKQLVNGTTVRQIATQTITYFHIELPQHAVILAEGLAAESYLDTGDRTSFAEGDVTRLHPLFGVALPDRVLVMDALGCAPLRVTGSDVDRVRAQLAVRVPAERATG